MTDNSQLSKIKFFIISINRKKVSIIRQPHCQIQLLRMHIDKNIVLIIKFSSLFAFLS